MWVAWRKERAPSTAALEPRAHDSPLVLSRQTPRGCRAVSWEEGDQREEWKVLVLQMWLCKMRQKDESVFTIIH